MDKSGIDNQPIELVDAAEASRLLGVKRETLYAYASRGLIRTFPGERARERRYAREDVLRLKTRAEARSGHTAVAAGALRWGEPVLDSAITEIREDGPWYRGRSAVALSRTVTFEQAAELLWTGALPDDPPVWAPLPSGRASNAAKLRAWLPSSARPLDVLQLSLAAASAAEERRFALSPEEEWVRARTLLRRLAGSVVPDAGAGRSVAEQLVSASPDRSSTRALQALNAALVLCADHELNVSSFSARITASAGADLHACVTSALATFSGPRHGAMCDRIEALLDEVGSPDRARTVVLERARRGEEVPGFAHPLYPRGDPRTPPLLELAAAFTRRSPRLRVLQAVAAAMAEIGRDPPSVDFGTVAVSQALRLPPGMATAIFALGRMAGWIAHALEQRASGVLLRPRARYVGPTAPRESEDSPPETSGF